MRSPANRSRSPPAPSATAASTAPQRGTLTADCTNSPSAYPSPSHASGIAYPRSPPWRAAAAVCRSTSRMRALRRRGEPIANAVGIISAPMNASTQMDAR